MLLLGKQQRNKARRNDGLFLFIAILQICRYTPQNVMAADGGGVPPQHDVSDSESDRYAADRRGDASTASCACGSDL